MIKNSCLASYIDEERERVERIFFEMINVDESFFQLFSVDRTLNWIFSAMKED
jgi:hypothetical protein